MVQIRIFPEWGSILAFILLATIDSSKRFATAHDIRALEYDFTTSTGSPTFQQEVTGSVLRANPDNTLVYPGNGVMELPVYSATSCVKDLLQADQDFSKYSYIDILITPTVSGTFINAITISLIKAAEEGYTGVVLARYDDVEKKKLASWEIVTGDNQINYSASFPDITLTTDPINLRLYGIFTDTTVSNKIVFSYIGIADDDVSTLYIIPCVLSFYIMFAAQLTQLPFFKL